MGYRSEVVLAVSPEAMPSFMSVIARCPETRRMCLEHTDTTTKDYDGDKNAMLFVWESIKWYDSYPEIQKITSWMDDMDDENDEGYKFVRIGEEPDDIDQRGYGYGHIQVVRSVQY